MNFGFNIYLLFIFSWFTHLSARLPVLGIIRFDLILIVMLTLTLTFGNKDEKISNNIKTSKTHKIITFLLIYIIVTLPFVQWPGSVINHGLENLIKAIVFYYFTIYFVTDEHKLKRFITVFIGCQSFRIIEPTYLHITQGYWGSIASMANWEHMDRLSGAPMDTVNPNGLAFIILTAFPFYYYLFKTSYIYKYAIIVLLPISIYALILTASRSGMVGLFAILCVIVVKSRNKILLLSVIFISILLAINYMGANFNDRYTSIFSSDTKNAATSQGRLEGVKENFIVALRRPFLGHGLGTSREVNANFGGSDQPSHNLYTEAAQELGFVGLIIFCFLIKSIIDNNKKSLECIKDHQIEEPFILSVNSAMQAWLYMNILFSFASYGLSSYEWYLFAGLSIAIKIVVKSNSRHEAMTLCQIKN